MMIACRRVTSLTAILVPLLLFSIVCKSSQQDIRFQDAGKDQHNSISSSLKDAEHGMLNTLESTDDLCSQGQGQGRYSAGEICLNCAAMKAITSATDCCHNRETFEVCAVLIIGDNDDDNNNDDGDNRLPLNYNNDDGFPLVTHEGDFVNDEVEDEYDNDIAAISELQNKDEEKRKSPFLGKRRSPFLGKRRSPFLGKRRSPFLGKRRSPFLGKRRSPFLGKRRSPFLGKRRSPFLGKRRSPFLGKRDDGEFHP